MWGVSHGAAAPKEAQISFREHDRPLRPDGGRSDVYAAALSELQELESEPLCHRIAARLLVNNCQLLDGRNEATVLNDSGRAASFVIPSSCARFREPILAGMPVPSKPQLHVSPSDIDHCLHGLSRSDSTWNTWVSYRHKALRFCEAARADNEKDKNIHLYQKITKVMANLTSRVEEELEARLEVLNKLFRDTSANAESIAPQMDSLKAALSGVDQILSGAISQGTQEAAAAIRGGLEDAKSLQLLLARLLETVLENEQQITRSHESALQVVSERVSSEVGGVVTTLGAAIAASTSLQRQLAESQCRAAEMARRQEKMEADMERLAGVADALTVKQQGHQEHLEQAQQTAMQVLHTLDSVSISMGTFRNSLLGGFGLARWWPFVLCSATSLIIGSYGLPPSAMRNILLLGLGEATGFIVSVASEYGADVFDQLAFAARNVSADTEAATSYTGEPGTE